MACDLADMEGLLENCMAISDLPPTLLRQQILSRLGPRDLCCLAAAGCRYLQSCSDADELWKVLTEARKWARNGQEPWKATFLRNQSKLCVSCNKFTKYQFVMTGKRLCDICEQANPDKYALVTVCEATEAHGLTSLELLDLTGPLKKLGTSFYLRSEVQKLKEEKERIMELRHQYSNQEDSKHDTDDDQEGETKHENFKNNAKQSKEEKRAARKANKQQVKLMQREKRIHGSSPPSAGRNNAHFCGNPHRRKAPSSNSRRQSHVRHTNEACDSPAMRSVSTCSSWIQERERLMTEYGEFGISGLALACD